MEIIDIEQRTEEWFANRLGSIGGSTISQAVAGGQGKTRTTLLYRLAGEIQSGVKYEGYSNHHMERGIEQENEARLVYQMETETEVQQVGLVRAAKYKHCSPDGLIEPDGILEIKCTIPSVHVETIFHNEIPAARRLQCQWGLHICQRQYVDFVSYSPLVSDNPIWIIRRGRDEKLIKKLDEGADKFILELAQVVRKVKEKKYDRTVYARRQHDEAFS